MRLELSAGPTTDPVTIPELREWLSFAQHVTEDDRVLQRVLDEEYAVLEAETNRRILTQTWDLYLDANEISAILELPLVPLVSVSSIKSYDDDDNETAVGAANYKVVAGERPRVYLAATGEWPSDLRDLDALKLTCVCGYNGAKVPYAVFVASSGSTDELDDMTPSGTFTGSAKTTHEVKITTAATTDKYRARTITRDANGVETVGAWGSETAITGDEQVLADGISVTFEATTGHAIDSRWFIQVYERLPARIVKILKGLVIDSYSSKGRGVTETVSGQLIGRPHQLQSMINSLRVQAL